MAGTRSLFMFSLLQAGVPPEPVSNSKSTLFDGIDDYVQLHSPFATSGTDWSISLWWKTTATGGNRYMIGGANTLIGGNWGNFRYGVPWPASVLWNMDYTMSWNDGNWHQAVFTYNYTSGDWKLYIDGSNVISQVASTGQDIRGTDIFGAGTASLYFFPGNLDEISYFSTELSASAVAGMYNSGVPTKLGGISGLLGWWRMGDYATFFSNLMRNPPLSPTIPTVRSGASISWEYPNQPQIDNWSRDTFDFDGVSDYFDCGASSVFDFPGGYFAISCWVNIEALAADSAGIVGKRNLVGNPICYMLSLETANKIRLLIDQSDTTRISIESDSIPSTGVWYHVVAVAGQKQGLIGDDLRMYINGILQTDIATYDATLDTHTDSLFIGRNANDYMNGLVDDVALWDKKLTPEQVTEIYNSGQPTDLSTFSTKSFAFDGVDDMINIPQTGELTGMSELTVSFWIYPPSYVYNASVMSFGGIYDGPFNITQWYGAINFYVSETSGWGTPIEGGAMGAGSYGASYTQFPGQWIHYVGIFDPAAGEIRTYQNGVLYGTYPTTFTTLYYSDTETLEIGICGSRTYWLGNIDEISIFNSVKSAAEVAAIYNSGKPTDLSAETGLIGYWRMGEDAIYDGITTAFTLPDNSTNFNSGVTANMDFEDLVTEAPLSPVGYWLMGDDGNWNNSNWQLADYSKKALFSQQSMDFDGVSDKVVFGSTIDLGTTSSESFWLKQDTPTAGENIIGIPWTASYHVHLGTDSTVYVRNVGQFWTFDDAATKTAVNTTNWIHIAIIRTGVTTCILYVNGVDNDGIQTNVSMSDSTEITCLGSSLDGSYPYQGLIDDYAGFANTALTQSQVLTLYNSGVPPDLTPYSTKSFEFDGIDDGIDCGAVSEIEGLAEVTLSAWIKRDAGAGGPGGWDMVCFKNPVLGFFEWGTANQMNFKTTTTSGLLDIQSDVGIFDGEWHHLCGTYDGTTQKLFQDGILVDSGAQTGVIATSVNNFWIGIQDGSAIPWVGEIDEVSIFDEVKSASDLYNSGKPGDLSAKSGLIGWWRMGEDALYNGSVPEFNVPDESPNSNTGTTNNMNLADLVESAPFAPNNYYRMGENATFNNADTWQIPEYTKINYWSAFSFAFDGADDYVNIPDSTPTNIITGLYTFSFWIKLPNPPAASSGWAMLYKDSASDRSYGVGIDTAYKVFTWASSDGNYNVNNRSNGDTAISLGEWHNIVITNNGSASTIDIYIDGVESTYDTSGGANRVGVDTVWQSTEPLQIGKHWSAGWEFEGNIDDVAVFDRVKDIPTLFNSGVPSDLSAEAGLAGYWRMGEGATWYGGRWNIPDVSPYGNNGSGENMVDSSAVNDTPQNTQQGLSGGMISTARKLISPTNPSRADGGNLVIIDNINRAPDNENQAIGENLIYGSIVEDVP